MAITNPLDLKASQIAVMDKTEVIDMLLHFKGRFALDFTPDYLYRQTANKLRHILFAAIMTNQHKLVNHRSQKD